MYVFHLCLIKCSLVKHLFYKNIYSRETFNHYLKTRVFRISCKQILTSARSILNIVKMWIYKTNVCHITIIMTTVLIFLLAVYYSIALKIAVKWKFNLSCLLHAHYITICNYYCDWFIIGCNVHIAITTPLTSITPCRARTTNTATYWLYCIHTGSTTMHILDNNTDNPHIL